MNDPAMFWGSFANDFHWERKWDITKLICRYNFDLQKGLVFVEVAFQFWNYSTFSNKRR
jgi:hypothetical protein